jgi:SAM-dependent methyltransferase
MFGRAAADYDRVRPGYPEQVVRWLIGERPRRVVDLGAGTGIFSRMLAAHGHQVLPVEPDPAMRERLVGATGLVPLAGSAEEIPLRDASVDAVTAAQAYHWFDAARALPEIVRVLRPGGVFCPLWNIRDDAVPWVREFSRLLAKMPDHDGGGSGVHARLALTLGGVFHPPERALFRHAVAYTAESLVALIRSRSYYLAADASTRATIEATVRKFATTHPDLAGRQEFQLPYVTVAYRARRRD